MYFVCVCGQILELVYFYSNYNRIENLLQDVDSTKAEVKIVLTGSTSNSIAHDNHPTTTNTANNVEEEDNSKSYYIHFWLFDTTLYQDTCLDEEFVTKLKKTVIEVLKEWEASPCSLLVDMMRVYLIGFCRIIPC